MKYLSYPCLLIVLLGCQPKQTEEEQQVVEVIQETGPSINRLNPLLDEIIHAEAAVEILAEGFDWTEGPLWLEQEDKLIFSDIPPNTIYSWSEEQGKQVYLTPSGYTGEAERGGEVGSNGLLLSPEGKLVLCQHGDRRLAAMNAPLDNPQPDYTTIIDNFQGKALNSPNDATFSSTGDLYFTDPPYGLEHNVDDPLKELDFQGVYKLDSDGQLHLLTDKMTRPNGIALSVDETRLYVANSDPEKAIWMEYHISEDGKIDQGRVFYDATSSVGKAKGLPDGLKVHSSGTIFATGPGGVWIFNPEGDHLGTIQTGQATSNCAFGNSNRYLYITADMYLMRVALL
ncbi:MAG: gluconolactonase [Cyclobacteriaceae bacterium]|nr:MAG: gluconolactonase [Cyclobacteriaceae bacterium]